MITTVTTVISPTMPVVDSPLDPEVADALGDELLLGSAATNKTLRVAGSSRSTWAPQSGESRAWTMSGNVD